VQAAGEALYAPRHRPIHGVPPLMRGVSADARFGDRLGTSDMAKTCGCLL
jgi:hypothetical protein